jgi:hypothetical protein
VITKPLKACGVAPPQAAMDKWLFCPVAEPGETNQSAFKAFPKTPRTAFNFTFGEGSARLERPNG